MERGSGQPGSRVIALHCIDSAGDAGVSVKFEGLIL